MYLVGVSGTAMFQPHDACLEGASKPNSSQPCPRTFAWEVRCGGSHLPTWCKTEKSLATLPTPNNLGESNTRTDLRDNICLLFQSLILIISNLLWIILVSHKLKKIHFFFDCVGSQLWYAGPSLRHSGFQVVGHRLSCPAACWILVPRPGIKPTSPALQGRFLTTGSPGKFPNSTF